MSARSLSPNATLTTSAGRVLPTMPKSMSQTSPRTGVRILIVEGFEQGGRCDPDFLVFEWTGIKRQQAPQHFVCKGSLFLYRKAFESVE